MILGMSIATFTLLHVELSLVGIAAGFVVMAGLIARSFFDRWNVLFLVSTSASVATGFAFPVSRITPAHIFGLLTTIALVLAVLARYRYRLGGKWLQTYIASTAIALYLNSFIAVVQAFQKLPALRSLAPTQSEAPFAAAQLFVLILCVGLAVAASKKLRGVPLPSGAGPQ